MINNFNLAPFPQISGSKRGNNLPNFQVMDLLRDSMRMEEAGEAIYHLEAGQPDQSAPQAVIDAAHAALDNDKIGYSESIGLLKLRERICQHYKDYYQVSITPDRVLITMGTSLGFVITFLAAFDSGDRVVMAAPGYPCYANILNCFGIETVPIATEQKDRFQLSLRSIQAEFAKKSFKGLLITSPANPAGTMIERTEFQAIIHWCKQNGVRLISDELYHGVTYEKRADTALEFDIDQTIVLNGFSKYYCMTGWRVGWIVLPLDMVKTGEKLAQNLMVSASSIGQLAAIKAFDCVDELDKRVLKYKRNRDYLLNELPRLGFEKIAPANGGFYLYADVSALCDNSQDLARQILDATGVACTSGVDFDPKNGHGYIRFAYARSFSVMEGAIKALRNWRQFNH